MSPNDKSSPTNLSRRYASVPDALLFQEINTRKKFTKPNAWDLETANKLEDIHCKIIAAFNARDFDPQSEVWQVHADKIEMESEIPWLGKPFSCSGVLDKDDFLRIATLEIARTPEMKVYCDCRTTTIDRKAGKARVTAYLQLTGLLAGVKLGGSCVSYFRWTDEKWLVYGICLLHGIDPLGI